MKIFRGKIISKKMQKTSTVLVERLIEHPVYRKRIRIVKKYHVHDDTGSKVGDVINFIPGKPFSKLKRWEIFVDKKFLGEKKKTKK